MWFTDQCIYTQHAGSSQELGPYCDRAGSTKLQIPGNLRSVRSAGAPFTGKIRPAPDFGTLRFNYRE